MPYCTVADLQKRMTLSTLIQLSNDTAGATTINAANVAECIKDADNLIDGYVRGAGFTVPLTPVPDLVNTWSVQLTLYNLRTRRTEGEGNETLEAQKKAVLHQLEQLQAGKISLGIETTETGFQAGSYKVNKTADDRVFPKDVLDKY